MQQWLTFAGRGASAHSDRSTACPGELQLERHRQGRGHAAARGFEAPHVVATQTATGFVTLFYTGNHFESHKELA